MYVPQCLFHLAGMSRERDEDAPARGTAAGRVTRLRAPEAGQRGEGHRQFEEGRGDGEDAREGGGGGWGAPGADAEEGRAVFRVVAADGDAAGWRVMGRELDDEDGHTTTNVLDLRFHHALPKCFNIATTFLCFWYTAAANGVQPLLAAL